MKRSEVAINKFLNGYNCAQSVLYSFCDELGLDERVALRMAWGFGAGMGRKEEVCGAVTGGIMVIGMKLGRAAAERSQVTDEIYLKTRELMDRFCARHGSYICRSLLDGCELTAPEGQKEFKEKDLKERVCKECVGSVVEILEAMIGERYETES